MKYPLVALLGLFALVPLSTFAADDNAPALKVAPDDFLIHIESIPLTESTAEIGAKVMSALAINGYSHLARSVWEKKDAVCTVIAIVTVILSPPEAGTHTLRVAVATSDCDAKGEERVVDAVASIMTAIVSQ